MNKNKKIQASIQFLKCYLSNLNIYLQKYLCIWMYVAQIALRRKGLYISERLYDLTENQGKTILLKRL